MPKPRPCLGLFLALCLFGCGGPGRIEWAGVLGPIKVFDVLVTLPYQGKGSCTIGGDDYFLWERPQAKLRFELHHHRVSVNGTDFGAVAAGDEVVLTEQGTLSVNGQERHPAAGP